MNILLPIETINREIDFKIALAAYLSNQGHRIYIGQHEFLMKLLPKMKEGGLYIGKNIFNKRANLEKGEKYLLLKKYNFNIVYLHEEGAVFAGDSENWITTLQSQYNLDFFDEKDDVCVWGDFQKKADEKRSKIVTIHTTGHPRLDLCKDKWHGLYDTKVQKLHEKYGDFVLINGNYGLANHGLGVEYVFSDKGNYNCIDEVQRLKRVNFYCHSSKLLMSMIQLTHQLAVKFPKINFVYRPHPSENHKFYDTVFFGVKNIIVRHDGPILPWILSSKVIIHDGCTTALEATLAGKPVINFKFLSNDEQDIWLPNQMGVKLDDFNEVNTHLAKIIDGYETESVNNNYNKVSELIYNFKGDSFESLLKVVSDNMKRNGKKKNSNISKQITNIIHFKVQLKSILYQLLKPSKRKNIYYHKNKFYGFQEKEIDEKVENVAAILDKKVKLTFHNSHLIEIE